MDVEAYYRSLTQELEAVKNRVRDVIGSAHWLTDGEWKETVLRHVLSARLPDTVKIGRGFVVSPTATSSQCDILLYKSSAPVLFREGDVVIVTPDAVLGVIEVKTHVDLGALRVSVGKLAAIGRLLERRCLLGLFSYESSVSNPRSVLRELQKGCRRWYEVISIVSLGNSTFVKWWDCKPLPPGSDEPISTYERWHSYDLDGMAAGYFLTNILASTCEEWLWWNGELWFPTSGKERYKTGEIEYREPGKIDPVAKAEI